MSGNIIGNGNTSAKGLGFKVVESELGKVGDKNVRILNISSEELEKAEDFPSGVHFIFVYDRSGSMGWTLSQLVDHMKATARQLRPGDYLSVFWYSGSNQFGNVVKFIRISGNDTDFVVLDQLLDQTKRTVGCTVFSQVLKEVHELVESTKDICSGVAINFFTDGQLVPDHQSREAERTETLAITEKICAMPHVLAFDTIGYGAYYDRDLLERMTGFSQLGVAYHSTNINDYLECMTGTIEAIKGAVPSQMEIVLGPGVEAMYLSDKGAYYAKETFTMKAMSKEDNKIVIFYPRENIQKDTEVSVLVGEDTVYYSNPGNTVPSAQVRTIQKVLYGIGSKLYQIGKRDDAYDLFAYVLKDKVVFQKMQKAFSVLEVGDLITHMHRAYVDPKFRAMGTLQEVVDSKTSFVRLIEELSGYQNVFIDMRQVRKEYRRIGAKNIDQGSFTEDYEAELLVPVESLLFHKDRLNLYLSCAIPGFVNLNAEEAAKVGLEEKFPAVRYKSYNLVIDGMLNIKNLPLVMKDKDEYTKLVAFLAQGEYGTIQTMQNDAEQVWSVSVPLVDLAVADRQFAKRFNYFNDGTEKSLARLSLRATILELHQKALGFLIDRFEETAKGHGKTEQQKQYSVAQLEVLSKHGLDSKLRYSGVGVSKDMTECDYVFARNFTIAVKGLVSMPKAEDAFPGEKKTIKPGSAADKMRRTFIQEYANFPFLLNEEGELKTKIKPTELNILRGALDLVKRELKQIRVEVGLAKFVKGCTCSWFLDLPLEDGNTKYECALGATEIEDQTVVTIGTTYTKLVVTSSVKEDMTE